MGRLRPTGSSGALDGGGLGNFLQLEARQAGRWVMSGHSGQPAIDDGGDLVDGQRSLRDVCRQNDFRSFTRCEGQVLLFGRQRGVQGTKRQAVVFAVLG